MSCSRGKASPDAHTKLRLFADSAGYCQNPECLNNLFLSIGNNEFHIAEMAHIFSASTIGPRGNVLLTEVEKGDYNNLILLCPTCHTKIDKAEEAFPENLIRDWKNKHKDQIDSIFNIQIFSTRNEARKVVKRILRQNKQIFDSYGPMGDERFNPESDMPLIWHRKILSTILPNNRKILKMIDANYDLLFENEEIVVGVFREHVNDFEAKHIDGVESSGILFPIELNDLFKN